MKLLLIVLLAGMLSGCALSPDFDGIAGSSHYKAMLFSATVGTFGGVKANSPRIEYPRETPIVVEGFDRY